MDIQCFANKDSLESAEASESDSDASGVKETRAVSVATAQSIRVRSLRLRRVHSSMLCVLYDKCMISVKTEIHCFLSSPSDAACSVEPEELAAAVGPQYIADRHCQGLISLRS